MGLDNPLHLAFIVVLLLLVFGAKRLPEMGRSLGAGMRGFKESISGETTPARIAEMSASSTTTPAAETAQPVVVGEPAAGTRDRPSCSRPACCLPRSPRSAPGSASSPPSRASATRR